MNKEKILGLIRHILTTVGGSGLFAGYASQDEVTAIVGGVVALAGAIWSWLAPEKKNA